jgi:hypothetical protein
MVKAIDFRQLSPAAINEIMVAAGVTDEDREWLRSRSEPVGALECPDRYKVSRAQQKKAHALLQAICRWSGYTPLETEKTITKQMFLDSQLPTVADEFSLSDCSREIARMYITYLIDFCLLHDIPCGEPMWKLAEDIPKYVYMALVHKRCAVCGQKAELHHVDVVGMGRNRKEICHLGMRVLPLCRKHHTEIHTIGREDFLSRYILEPVKVDERVRDVYHLSKGK